jgi:hypothetical protein
MATFFSIIADILLFARAGRHRLADRLVADLPGAAG